MIVIPMAGASSRFSQQGYHKPKFMLPLKKNNVFEYSLIRFKRLFDTEFFLFIILEQSNTENFIKSSIAKLGINHFGIVSLEHKTGGQAETVYLGLNHFNSNVDQPLIIFNIDTICIDYNFNNFLDYNYYDGVLEVFKDEGSHWSFVLPDNKEEKLVLRTTEKERISDLCCSGLYQFRDKHIFDFAFIKEMESPTYNELFVAPLYNHLINSGCPISYFETKKECLVFAGIPSEYEIAKSLELPDLS